MDNITHSLTGAFAAKVVERTGLPAKNAERAQRVIFWLTVLCANLPDIDSALNISGDPLYVIKYHRGLTHSLLAAPVLAFLPAIVAYLLTSVKQLKLLWMMALLGIYLHIFFDVITTFGTQLFAPFSTERYSLDWMFIIDPLFTFILALVLFLGKKFPGRKNAYILAGGLFVVSYLLVEMVSHQIAVHRVANLARQQGVVAENVSALPQPLNIFRWMGLVQASDAVYQTFFHILDNPETPPMIKFSQASDPFVAQALQTEEARWFMKFARHPWIQSKPTAEGLLVEIRDQQFSFNPELAAALGFAERQPPFVLRFLYSPEGNLLSIAFNR
jgi:inner membrane protein